MTYYSNIDDQIWKAVSDGRRRQILDSLMHGPQSTGDLVKLFPAIGRTGVLRHIDILEAADLITVKRQGRVRWNYINTEPLERICSPWVTRHVKAVTSSIADLKKLSER